MEIIIGDSIIIPMDIRDTGYNEVNDDEGNVDQEAYRERPSSIPR